MGISNYAPQTGRMLKEDDTVLNVADAIESIKTTAEAGATSAKQDTGNTSLASILAKIIAAPATEAKQDAANASLANIKTAVESIIGAEVDDAQTASFVSTDAQYTPKTITFSRPDAPARVHFIYITNESEETDVHVFVRDAKTDLADIVIGKNYYTVSKKESILGVETEGYLIALEGLFVRGDCKLIIVNDAALTVDFDVTVELYAGW
jgi:hypothetical protein